MLCKKHEIFIFVTTFEIYYNKFGTKNDEFHVSSMYYTAYNPIWMRKKLYKLFVIIVLIFKHFGQNSIFFSFVKILTGCIEVWLLISG